MGSPTSTRLAEVAGGVTADCATVWCCFPYTAANLLTLVIYKVPTRICRKALKRHKKREMMKKGLLPLNSGITLSTTVRHQNNVEGDIPEFQRAIKVVHEGAEVTFVIGGSKMDEELMELDKEMIRKFTGFWRSYSEREHD
ncbi:hypothetical protein BVRB_3g053820 [Beta vulgaris subsp. vulgaris]|nr:hypothetical protein BVRB_3g053820 [Beta vulgaris subsp. vulgaris]